MDSPFDVLGVAADADKEAIERAYRKRVIETHPDQGGSPEAFQAVRTAYEMIVEGYREPEDRAGETETEDGPDWYRSASSRVTYLDYDVLQDLGWETDDDNLFEKAANAGLEREDYGQFRAEPGETLLEAAERRGFAWPFACRGGACANCAILLLDGELSMPVSHVLPPELLERGFRLSCNGIPITDEVKVVFNVKHDPQLDDLLLPPRPFKQAHSDD